MLSLSCIRTVNVNLRLILDETKNLYCVSSPFSFLLSFLSLKKKDKIDIVTQLGRPPRVWPHRQHLHISITFRPTRMFLRSILTLLFPSSVAPEQNKVTSARFSKKKGRS